MKKNFRKYRKLIIISLLAILVINFIPYKEIYMRYNIKNLPMSEIVYLEDINKTRTLLSKEPITINQVSVNTNYAGNNLYLHQVKVDNELEGLFITIAIPTSKDQPLFFRWLERHKFEYFTFYISDFEKVKHIVP